MPNVFLAQVYDLKKGINVGCEPCTKAGNNPHKRYFTISIFSCSCVAHALSFKFLACQYVRFTPWKCSCHTSSPPFHNQFNSSFLK